MDDRCAYPDCDNPVDEDDYCHGCDAHICYEHSISSPFGVHEVEDHWDDYEEEY